MTSNLCSVKSVCCIILLFIFWFFSMCDCNPNGLDLKIPRNVYLTAFYKRSFAHHTVKNRMPTIVTQIIDSLVRVKEEISKDYGEEGQEDLKMVIGELSKLKYEIQTNKPLRKIVSNASDVAFYNNYINDRFSRDGNVTFFSTIWLLSECYMYRRIQEAFELTHSLKGYDPFLKQKKENFLHATEIMTKLAQYLSLILSESEIDTEHEFLKLLKINLWGNKCDLSISGGVINSNIEELFNVDNLDPNILCDQSAELWATVSNGSVGIIDVVLDNSGYELFTDLCIADFLISKNLATNIRFFVKTIPWFISDVMKYDFFWTLEHMKLSTDDYLKKLGERWWAYVNNETWVVIENEFWTLPVDFTYMERVAPSLYRQLAEAKLVIVKGDLNYRKLFGEKNWDPITPVVEALQNFHPTKLATLRTIKSDIVCGLAEGVAEKAEEITEKWMENGDYGLIQFSDKIISI